MEHIINQSTDLDALVGQTFSTGDGCRFELLGASHAPEIGAMAYMARAEAQSRFQPCYLFFAFLPYGKALIG